MRVIKVLWPTVVLSICILMLAAVAIRATPPRPSTITLPPLPTDAVEILNITHDSDVGVCVGYIDNLGKPRMIQYGFRDVYNYDIINTFCFSENTRGWRPKLRTDVVIPSLPKYKKIVSVTHVSVGIVVGFINDKNEYELIQYSNGNVFRFQFHKGS